jgi:hypothetical protein
VLAAGAAGVFLCLSVTRSFLPGMAELSVAFAVGTLFVIALGMARQQRAALAQWVKGRSSVSLVVMLAGAMWLAAAAGLAVAFHTFPWPVALLGGALLVLLSFAPGGAPDEAPAAPAR